MQIKVERFLTLTAMLASAQVGLVACGDDGANSEPSANDAGNTQRSSEAADSGQTPAGDAGTGQDTDELNATLDGPDASADDAAAGDAAVGDADVTFQADASPADAAAPWIDGGATWLADAGGETIWWDAGGEGAGDGGVACLDGDFADEEQSAACYATFGACETYTLAASTCENLLADYRAGIVETFWDCYNEAEIADPCSEQADYAASTCYSFSVENAPLCAAAADDCAAVVENCSEVTLEACQGLLEQYNSASRARTLNCFADYSSNQPAPSYEGCGYDFYYCVNWSPSVE